MRRFGNFLIFIGLMLVVLFVFSDIAKSTDFNLLVVGGIAVLVGSFIRAATPKPPTEPVERFRLLRKRSKDEDPDQRKPTL